MDMMCKMYLIKESYLWLKVYNFCSLAQTEVSDLRSDVPCYLHPPVPAVQLPAAQDRAYVARPDRERLGVLDNSHCNGRVERLP